jgi:hypothetical protein
MKQQGYLLITDISGYTSFLTQAELEHAHDILDSLFKTLLGSIHPPLAVAKLEGDAIFAFSPRGSFYHGQTLLETVENLYYAFALALETMRINTTCTCNACKLIPTLDLKFAIHYGEFIVSKVGGSEELSGTDVILVHRLLKNTIIEKTGVEAYAYFTRASVEAAQLTEMASTMLPHTENYEHLGDVEGYVYDLKPIWKAQREARRICIKAEEADLIIMEEVPVLPAAVWGCLLKPEYRNAMNKSTKTGFAGLKAGRISVGSEFHCYHGERLTRQTVIDWQPFEYYTSEDRSSMMFINGMTTRYTIHLVPEGENTRIQMAMQPPGHTNPFLNNLLRLMWKGMMRQMFFKEISEGMQALKAKLIEDLSAEEIVNKMENPEQRLDPEIFPH